MDGAMDGAQAARTGWVAAQVTGAGRVRILDNPLPLPAEGEVRVKLEGCGVCASNLGPWAGPEWMNFPLAPGALGHEGWGRIDALGQGVDPARLGERVAIFGDHGFASHDIVPADAALPIPERLKGQPVPAEPVACALFIFRMSRIKPGDRVAIIGIGFLGLLLTRLARRAGAEVIALSRAPGNLQRAAASGAGQTISLQDHAAAVEQVHAATGGRGADICIECTGHQAPLDLAAEITRESGRLVIAGYHQNGPRQVNMQLWNWRAFEIVNAHLRDRSTLLATMRDAIDAMARGEIEVGSLLTHHYPLHRLADALNATRDKPAGFIKAVIRFDQADARPRLGFLGLGWIGLNRMETIATSGIGRVAVLGDFDPAACEAARAIVPQAHTARDLEAVLAQRPDGVVIATPSALHAPQAITALQAGAAVFCQKPLGRSAQEAQAVVDAARRADRLLAVDLSYRHTAAMQAVAAEIASGRLGTIYDLELVFHNAYGPDKAWFFDRKAAGGGCLIDLGVHLVDLALWLLGTSDLTCHSALIRAKGAPLTNDSKAVEDFAVATLESDDGVPVRLGCSWNLSAGCDAVIAVDVHGTKGGASFRNINGSFYDFEAYRHTGCRSERLVTAPDDWGGRAALDWVRKLSQGARFDPDCTQVVAVAGILDQIYRAAGIDPEG
jgi:predicted dehydrogenase/threonine dehydrogenase-like Zn-dependent dehydrogenase